MALPLEVQLERKREGGYIAAANMTPEQRIARARLAGNARDKHCIRRFLLLTKAEQIARLYEWGEEDLIPRVATLRTDQLWRKANRNHK